MKFAVLMLFLSVCLFARTAATVTPLFRAMAGYGSILLF